MRTKLVNDVMRIGESLGFDTKHASHVRAVALELFDQLQDLHRMGNTEKLWLQIAALLHDVGKVKNRRNHHKFARDFIADCSFLPFGKKEKQLIGLIARYHRGPLPTEKHKYFGNLDHESKKYVAELASILRIADGLGGGISKIRNIFCNIQDSEVIVNLNCTKLINLGKVLKKAELFEDVFGKSLVFNMQITDHSAEKAIINN